MQTERVTAEERFAAEEELLERKRRHLEKDRKFAAQLDGLDAKYRGEMRALIGEDKVKKATPKHRELLEKLVKCPTLFDASPKGRNKEEEYRKQIVKERHGLYRSLGFDHEKAIKLRKVYMSEAISVMEQGLEIEKEPEYVLRDVTLLPRTDNPWSAFRPGSYSDTWGDRSSSCTWGTCEVSHSENRSTGAIYCSSYSKAVGTDDSDTGSTRAMSEIQVLYRMPAAGQLEVWATLEDRDTRLHGALLNESGCSDGYVRQITRGYFWSSGCEQQYRNIRDKAVESNGKDVSWTDELSGYGDLSLIHLKSTATYRQGELVTAAIGVRDDTSFRVDDMAVDPSKITSSYIVREILLRSTGAP